MYTFNKPNDTDLQVNQSYTGERIEEKINRILNNKEPISDGAPIIYTARKDGVQPQYNVRTDRFEIAIDAMDKVAKSHIATREQNIKNFTDKLDKANQKNNPGGESVQGTDKQ